MYYTEFCRKWDPFHISATKFEENVHKFHFIFQKKLLRWVYFIDIGLLAVLSTADDDGIDDIHCKNI